MSSSAVALMNMVLLYLVYYGLPILCYGHEEGVFIFQEKATALK